MFKTLRWLILFGLVLTFSFQPSGSGRASKLNAQAVTLKILHTNDIHTGTNEIAAEVFGRLAAFVSEVRNAVGPENVLLLDGGDMSTNYRCDNEDAFIADEMFKYVGYNAIAPGNHEWDCGKQLLVSREKNLAPVSFLTANMTRKDSNGKCTWKPYFDAYQIFKMGPKDNPVRVAVLGLNKGTGAVNFPDICSHPHLDALIHYYDIALSEGAEVFVLAVHEGVKTPYPLPYGMGGEVLLKAMTDAGRPIHLVIGGHTHELMNEKIGETILAQSGEFGENIGIATLTINRTDQGVIVKSSWDRKRFSKSDPQDPGIAEMIASYSIISPFEFRHILP